MATTLKDDIRESIIVFDEQIKFSYGRNLDNALKSAKLEIDNYLVCLDPPTYGGSLNDSTQTATCSISWLKLDDVDSEADKELNEAEELSMEEIVDNCRSKCLQWLESFKEKYHKKYSVDQWTGFEAFRVKHIVTGFVISIAFSYRKQCS